MENSPAKITLRDATIEDLAILRRWDEDEGVIASDPNDDWNWETELRKNPEWREQLVAEAEERPVGFIQIIDPEREETRYWGDCGPNLRAIDIWIGEARDRGKGYGTMMMRLALDRCFRDPAVRAVVIDPLKSNVEAIRFYERLGFIFVEHRTFGSDRCAVYRLSGEQWKKNQHHGKNP